MLPATNGIQQVLSGVRGMRSVPALFRPGLDNLPICSEVRVPPGLFDVGVLESCNPYKFPQIVRMAGVDFLFFWKFVTLRSLCNACLERAFYCIPGQIISAIEQPGSKQSRRFPEPQLREALEIPPVHETSSYRPASHWAVTRVSCTIRGAGPKSRPLPPEKNQAAGWATVDRRKECWRYARSGRDRATAIRVQSRPMEGISASRAGFRMPSWESWIRRPVRTGM